MRASVLAGCRYHATEESRAENARLIYESSRGLEERLRHEREQRGRNRPPRPPFNPADSRPACWSWPVTEADREFGSLHEWQAGQCAVCANAAEVLDHDHETGYDRGYLCRGCNISEGSSVRRVFQRYRRWNPARILGVWTRYDSPFTNVDYGKWQGKAITGLVPVTSAGVVLFDAPESELVLSARLTERVTALLAGQQP